MKTHQNEYPWELWSDDEWGGVIRPGVIALRSCPQARVSCAGLRIDYGQGRRVETITNPDGTTSTMPF